MAMWENTEGSFNEAATRRSRESATGKSDRELELNVLS
jgi:hypothetical protein